jgi:hypothetical protein
MVDPEGGFEENLTQIENVRGSSYGKGEPEMLTSPGDPVVMQSPCTHPDVVQLTEYREAVYPFPE